MATFSSKPLFQVTPQALEKITEWRYENPHQTHFRVAIHGGGCAGFQYDFSMIGTTDLQEDDFVFQVEGLDFVIDSFSLPYFEDATLDYESSWMNSRIVVHNPKAQHTCGCGSSISF